MTGNRRIDEVDEYLPRRVNSGSFLTAYTWHELQHRIAADLIVLPICSLGTPASELASLAPLVLPPLYHEALDQSLKDAIVDRVRQCFPYYLGTRKRAEFQGRFEIVELPPRRHAPLQRPRMLALSIDTAVEEHGPHLPLATDTIQSYAVLRQLALTSNDVMLGPPLDYGQLTWGLPFGLSIDLTAPLVVRYVTAFVNAILDWMSPEALYVVDVHGSIIHRTAIQQGLAGSRCQRWAFRWLYEPLVEFTSQRGDQHAGGVETALMHFISPELVDPRWWPVRLRDLSAGQMPMQSAIELSQDLEQFIQQVESKSLNGIVGDVRNFFAVDAADLFHRMLAVAQHDLKQLMEQ